MRGLGEFLKTSALGGFFVLLPLLLLEMMLEEMFELAVKLAKPLTELLPTKILDEINAPALVAIVLILVASFLFGLIARSEHGNRFGSWVERNTFARFPLYRMLKGFSRRLLGFTESSTTLRPVLLISSEGQRQFAYLIEEHGDGWVTIMVPWAPTPMSGEVRIVRSDQVEMLDARFGDVTRVLSHWGMGAAELLKGHKNSGP